MGKDRGEKVLLQTHYKRAKGLTKLEGFDKFQAKLANLPKNVENNLGLIVFDEAKRWAGLASRKAPRNKVIGLGGKLAQGVRSEKTGSLTAEVTSNVMYSPYVEWGTGSKVSVPPDLASYAIQFKGTRIVVGQRPQPFFFIFKDQILKSLVDRAKAYLSKPQ